MSDSTSYGRATHELGRLPYVLDPGAIPGVDVPLYSSQPIRVRRPDWDLVDIDVFQGGLWQTLYGCQLGDHGKVEDWVTFVVWWDAELRP